MNPTFLSHTLARWNRRGLRAVNQGLILHLLSAKGPHAIAALVEATGDTRQATDVAVKQLLRKKWVAVTDRRLPGVPRTIKVVSITDAGLAAVGSTVIRPNQSTPTPTEP